MKTYNFTIVNVTPENTAKKTVITVQKKRKTFDLDYWLKVYFKRYTGLMNKETYEVLKFMVSTAVKENDTIYLEKLIDTFFKREQRVIRDAVNYAVEYDNVQVMAYIHKRFENNIILTEEKIRALIEMSVKHGSLNIMRFFINEEKRLRVGKKV